MSTSESIDQYFLPDVVLSAKEVAIAVRLNTLITSPDTREDGLSFILKQIPSVSFCEFLLRIHPKLYTHLLKSTTDDLASQQASLFIVHALSIYPKFIELLVNYDLIVFDELKGILQNSESSKTTPNILEVIYNATAMVNDVTIFKMFIPPLVTIFRQKPMYRNQAGKCLCILLSCSSNQIVFIKEDGIFAIITVLNSSVANEQSLAVSMLLQLIKNQDKEFTITVRKIVIMNNVLQLIKPLLSAQEPICTQSWQVCALLTLACGQEKQFIQSGVFFDAVELMGGHPFSNNLQYALAIILAVTLDAKLLDVCRGFLLADRLRHCVESLNLYEPALWLVLLNIVRNLVVDEGLCDELRTVKISSFLRTPYNIVSLEKARVEILSSLKDEKTPIVGRDSIEVKRCADFNMKKTQAKNIIEEIVTTEEDYCGHLRCIVEEIRPAFQVVMTEKEVSDIFLNVEVVAKYQDAFLEALHSRWEKQKKEEWVKVSDLFDQYFSDRMKNIYCVYMTRANDACEYYQKQKKESRKIRKVALDLGIKHIFVPTFLVYPIQRLPRYLMLIETLIKNTPDTSEEHAKLIEVKEKSNKAVVWLNDEMRKYEDHQALMKWSAKLELELVENRKYIAEFHQVMVKENKIAIVCSIIVFSDIVVFLKHKKNREKVMNSVALINLKVFEVEDEKTTFMLVFPNTNGLEEDHRYNLYLTNEDEMREIFSTIKKAANAAKTEKKSLLTRSFSMKYGDVKEMKYEK
ncbi:Rho/RAC guanine nucleotide exchange factor, putative [Entamoeba invadens IP1]|uniref:Rho/RAC guanine nucleotide exchange factor, putative n=1 Tax=Entamoeba invadens IP1 TaxID=370355 RepID=A0A0A1TZS5_ENTIV|nr:Rho/RAC guanine nucleotide exchange factor, putative [Entamoeba invadens IP1]ELP87127.1 Rho/RAC guanine nucleotide exchange factor, putative [Entamoeba invadens IP1]|eukprot:XP_004253898.1 Rho/RAC guanine nucleotide exchange factor, putative [Entamoeba invadens IP1]